MGSSAALRSIPTPLRVSSGIGPEPIVGDACARVTCLPPASRGGAIVVRAARPIAVKGLLPDTRSKRPVGSGALERTIPAMEFSVTYEFAVNRRIPWDDDQEMFEPAHWRCAASCVGKRSRSKTCVRNPTSKPRDLRCEFVVFGTNRQSVENEVRELVGEAIRDSGAYHQGLYPVNEEMRLRPRLNTWSGLRTPTWRVRRSQIQLETIDRRRCGQLRRSVARPRSGDAGLRCRGCVSRGNLRNGAQPVRR